MYDNYVVKKKKKKKLQQKRNNETLKLSFLCMTLYDAYFQYFHCIMDVTNRHNICFN